MSELRRALYQLFLADGLFRLLPLRRKRILFSSFYGQHYSDGPRAISEALHRQHPELLLRWEKNVLKI